MKKAFQISTTTNLNAMESKTYEVEKWLKAVLFNVANETPDSKTGKTVTVIVEIIN